ncbi:3-hydroxy-2-methylbutyryl-CoA dehydrogenase [Sphingobium sp. SCG-1]|uniref:SDR family NAD(P)-dependent oxidoreductase n=1 Tax=Sphingobium sp. SCG-1 TaxID=2072936 RepID=UPI000CD68CFA|nr:SDR family NAD(P)-dependent oxidoreductase [Sphingobium sp. SCG-1]AUW57517.1 3-hydroxy-2-methylbutyryl-CoA dehydrogenase [Sphingobium sp. SCG-1]
MKLNIDVAAVVTGGASGLGEATARALAAEKVMVAIFDVNEERGTVVAEELGGSFHKVDVTSDDSVADGFVAARAANGQERILVNCAGIVMGAKTLSRDRTSDAIQSFPMDKFERVVAINLIGAFRCVTRSAAGMATLAPTDAGERGVIINTASVAAIDGQIGQAAYSASKAGIMGLTLPVARDLSSEGIRINAILPGIMETPMMAGMSQTVRDALGASVPFPKRLGRPDEFASLVLEICRNSYLNGEAIRLDGAIRMAPR